MVDSCRTCPSCKAGLGAVLRAGADAHVQRSGQALRAASRTAATPSSIVVDENFVLNVPTNLDLAGDGAAAVRGDHHLFAAATLGGRHGAEGRHRRPRRARSHGLEVRPRVRCARRAVHHVAGQDARTRKRLGADEVVISRNADEMAKHAGSFDFILDCVSAQHDINAYLQPAQAATARWRWSARPSIRCPWSRSTCCCRAVSLPARRSAGSPKRRRCSTSAASTTSPATSR